MILRVLAVSMIGFTLAGCVSSSGLSGDVYSASEAKQVQSVTYGTIVHTRAVQIQGGDDSNAIGAIGGAVLGGFLGNTIGGGTGRSLATAAGAVAGGVAGQGVQGAMNKPQGVELEIRLRYPHAKPYPCGPDGPLIYIKDVSFTNINKRYKYIYIFLPHLNSLRPRNIPPAAIK